MRTYRAELAKHRLKPLCEAYMARAVEDLRIRNQGWGRRQANETTCPYCGVTDQLHGTIRVGAKTQETGVPMTREGFQVQDARARETEILVIHCTACDAAIDPVAYTTPSAFVANREQELPGY